MNIIGQLKEKIKSYLDAYVQLAKLEFISRTANVLGYVLFATIAIFITFGIVLIFGFGLAEAVVALGLPKVAAYFIVLAFYVLLLVIFIASRKRIVRFFANDIVKMLTKDDTDNE
jgi:hypothetical protein